MSGKALFIPSGTGPQHFVFGDLITVKIHGRDTGGVFAQMETNCGPKIGPPLHVHHREEETFFVLEGQFEFVCGEQQTIGGPGIVVHLPRNVAHRFKNIGETQGRLLITLTPAGIEEFFEEVGALPPEERSDLPKIAALAARYGLEILGGA